MTTFSKDNWELPLIAQADDATLPRFPSRLAHRREPTLLDRAYARCEAITAKHSRSFYLASGVMKGEIRKATRTLYAFCRTTDDIVDESGPGAAELLDTWRERAFHLNPPEDDLVAVAWAETRVKFNIPELYVNQLFDGVSKDLTVNRYQSFDDLAAYCYGVASTVGLMSMQITGYRGEDAGRYAIRLGVALQLTNILRDVGEDWRRGRLYLPQDELDSFGLSESDIDEGQVTGRWREYMAFQIARVRSIYRDAWPGIRLLHPDGRFAIAAAATFYSQILDAIEANDYDVFSRRAYVGSFGKVIRIPGLWFRTRR